MSYGQFSSNPRPAKPEVTLQRQAGKRQRFVFPTDEVPHLWAHRTQSGARNPGFNLYFEGDTIYSYGSHFPIARHVQNKRGNKAVLFTTRNYSVTTSGHISAVRGAIPHGVPTFNVNRPDNDPKDALKNYTSAIETLAQSAFARKMETTRNQDVSQAQALIAECRSFCKFFGFRVPKFAKLPKIDARKLSEQRNAIIARRDAANAARRAKWEAEQAQRKAQADEWNASGVCTHTPKHDAHKWGEVHTCERMREDEEWTAKSAEIIQAWRQGDPNARLRFSYDLPVMLRVSADQSEVETSRGARVPVSHALRGLRFVRAVVARGEAFQTNGHTFHLGHYEIERIDVDGTLTAGCHVISYTEIERLAPSLESLSIPESNQAVL